MKTKKLYISVSENNCIVAVLCFDNRKSMNTTFFDVFHDNGYTVKEITKKEYDEYDKGDELTLDDIKNKNYKKE